MPQKHKEAHQEFGNIQPTVRMDEQLAADPKTLVGLIRLSEQHSYASQQAHIPKVRIFQGTHHISDIKFVVTAPDRH